MKTKEVSVDHRKGLLARIEKRISVSIQRISEYNATLAEAKRGSSTSKVGSINVSTRYDASDIKECEEQIEKWTAALNDWKLILVIVAAN